MYRNFIKGYRESTPSGLPARIADPDLRTSAKPTFVRIGEGNEPRNELLRVVNQYPSKEEVRTKVLGDMFARDETNPYFNRPDNIAAIRSASEELGIPLESTGLRIAANPFRLEGAVADVNLLAQVTNKAAGNLQRSGKPTVANALTRKAQFFNQPRSYRELAVDGTEGIDSILDAVSKAEPRVTASSQGNRPILVQADGLDPNIGIPTGSPENIPWDNIEGMRGSNAYKPADELKRPRFIDEGTGIYTRSGERINADQKNLLDTGMADLEDRSFILRDPASVNQTFTTPQKQPGPTRIVENVPLPIAEQYRSTTRLGLQTLGLNADIGSEVVLPAVDFNGMTLFPEQRNTVRATQPVNRLTNDLSNRVLSGDVDLRNYEPFKSNNTPQYYLDQSREFVGPIRAVKDNTYGATQGRTPWREYYSDPFVYEDKGLDGEVNRLMQSVNKAPAQLENAYTQQSLANRRAIDASDKLKLLGQHQSVRMGLLPQGEGVVNLAREVRKDRRMAEIDAAKANDTIAQLKAAQELMGVEYMVKPKLWGSEMLDDYTSAARTKGAMKDSDYSERIPTTDSLGLWRTALDSQAQDSTFARQYSEPDRDYDIASLFGFSGNY